MAEKSLTDRVVVMAKTGMTAIEIHESLRKQELAIPWVSVLEAYQSYLQSKKGG